MQRINSANMAAGNKFQDANAAIGQLATSLNAQWYNTVQEELMTLLATAGIAPNAALYNQVQAAINYLIAQAIAAAAPPNATTSLFGLVKLAAGSDAIAGTSATLALTPQALASGLTMTGTSLELELPGGLIFKAGVVSGVGGNSLAAVVFDDAFPNYIIYGDYIGDAFDSNANSTNQLSSYTQYGMTLRNTVSVTSNLLWFAFGG